MLARSVTDEFQFAKQITESQIYPITYFQT